jgi:hypothetical protein
MANLVLGPFRESTTSSGGVSAGIGSDSLRVFPDALATSLVSITGTPRIALKLPEWPSRKETAAGQNQINGSHNRW